MNKAPDKSENPIAVLGANGKIGHALLAMLAERAIGLSRSDCDLTNIEGVLRTLDQIRPSALINCAAYTYVDRAESTEEEKRLAEQVNGVAPGELAHWAERRGIPFVHYSTDYVFSGEGSIPWKEEDRPAPLNVYGRTKLEGEQRIASAGGKFLILRTSWVYGTHGNSFLTSMLKQGRERERLSVVNDQFGAPCFAKDIAEATCKILEKTPAPGIYHVVNSSETTWYGFANEIFARLKEARYPLRLKELVPVSSEDYPTPAVRPRNSRLSSEKFSRTLGWVLRPWNEALGECLEEKLGNEDY